MKTIKQLTAGVVIASQLFATSAYAFDLSSVVHLDAGTKNMLSNLKFMANGGMAVSLDQMTPATLSRCSGGSEMYNPGNQRQAQAYIQRFKEITAKYSGGNKTLTPDQALEVTCAALPMLRYMEQVDRQTQAANASTVLKSATTTAAALEKPLATVQQAADQGKLPPKSVKALKTAEQKAQAADHMIAEAQKRDLANTDSNALVVAAHNDVAALQNAVASPPLQSYYAAAYSSAMSPNGNIQTTPDKPIICWPNDYRLVNIRWACTLDELHSLYGSAGAVPKLLAKKMPINWNQVPVSSRDYGMIKSMFQDASKGLANKTVEGIGHLLLPLIKSPGVDVAIHAMPFIGNGLSIIEALSGKDWLTGETLDPASRLVSFMGIIPEGNLAAGMLRNAGVTSDLMLSAARAVDFLGKPQVQLAAGALTSNTADSVYSMASDVTIGGSSVTQTMSSVASEARSYLASNPTASNPTLTQATGNQTYTSMRGILAKTGAV